MKEILITLSVMAALIYTMFYIGYVGCQQLSGTMNKETKFSVLNGCFVKIDNSFVPIDNWRSIK